MSAPYEQIDDEADGKDHDVKQMEVARLVRKVHLLGQNECSAAQCSQLKLTGIEEIGYVVNGNRTLQTP
jgi:hypothetical protein